MMVLIEGLKLVIIGTGTIAQVANPCGLEVPNEFVTTHPSKTEPETPAVKFTLDPFVPDVNTPPVMVQV